MFVSLDDGQTGSEKPSARGPKKHGACHDAGPVLLTSPQFCTHQPGIKCVHTNACLCRAANQPCTSGCPSENFRNWGLTRAPTSPRLTTNVSENTNEAQEAAPALFQSVPPVVFHQDAPAFSLSVLLRRDKWPDIPARANTTHAAPALTNTAAPDPAALAAIRSGKRNSNHA